MPSSPDPKAMIAAVFDRSADTYEQVGPEFFGIFFLPDPAAAVTAWRQALKPGGRLAVSTFVGTQDRTYDQAMKTMAGFLDQVDAPPRRPAEVFRTAVAVTEVLTGGGFTDVRHEDVTFVTRFTGLDQWLEWVWSHGGRAVLERLPEDRAEAARAAAYEVMEAARTPDGGLAVHTTVRYTTATPDRG